MQPMWAYIPHFKQSEETHICIEICERKEFEKGKGFYTCLTSSTFQPPPAAFPENPWSVGLVRPPYSSIPNTYWIVLLLWEEANTLVVRSCSRIYSIYADDKNSVTKPSFGQCRCLRQVIMVNIILINIKSWNHGQYQQDQCQIIVNVKSWYQHGHW